MNCSNNIIVAFSGGPDSVFLVHFLQKNFPMYRLILAHFQHHLRGAESEADAKFCEHFAKTMSLVFERGDWKTPQSSEEKARNARYAFLEHIRKKHYASWIALGHHQNDQVETILLQFLRGGSLGSLQGMKVYDKERFLWRPLLGMKKKDIIDYLENNAISYCIDASNLDPKWYLRNFLRIEIIPLLEQKFTGFSNRLSSEAERMQELHAYLETIAEQFTQKNPREKGIPIVELLHFPSHIQRIIIKRYTSEPFSEVSYFQALRKFLQSATSGKCFQSKKHNFTVYSQKLFIEEKL